MLASRKAIALLITLFFIMLITVSIGIGLKQMQAGASEVKNEVFLLQTSLVLDDVMNLLKKNKELADLNSSDELQMVLDMVSFPLVPLAGTELSVGVNLSSARSKFNINTIADVNTSVKELFDIYFLSQMIEPQYLDMVEDVINGIRADMLYKTNIFYDIPSLFKDKNNYISSYENLLEINRYYKKSYNNDKIDTINFQKLFVYNKDNDYHLDLNCAEQETLEILGLSKEDVLVESEDSLEEDEPAGCSSGFCESLTESQRTELAKYRATCTPQMYIDVLVDIVENNNSASIKFEYNLLTKKGSNFVYEI